MAKSIPTLATGHLVGSPFLLFFGHAVLTDGLGEGRPRGRVLEFGPATEQLVSTFRTHIHTGLKVVFKDFASSK